MFNRILAHIVPARMRRVLVVSSVMALLCSNSNELHRLAKEVNDERHIADDESAFEMGFVVANWFLKSIKNQVVEVSRSDWVNRVIAMLPPYALYDKDSLQVDLRTIQTHLHV